MRTTPWILLLLFVFVAGVFVGIWLDWKHKTRDIVYQVENYQRANVEVNPGDTISVVSPEGKPAGLQMKFVGYNPCVDQTPSASCTIDTREKNAPAGPYFFTCSGGGLSCPDPGMQQSSTGPIEISYVGAVETDLFGVQSTPQQAPTPPVAGLQPATKATTAYVSCDSSNNTVLQDLNGNPITTITASKGESVFWVSSRQFKLDTTNFPTGLCSPADLGGSGLTESQCVVAMSGQSKTYTVQATACTANSTEQLTTTN